MPDQEHTAHPRSGPRRILACLRIGPATAPGLAEKLGLSPSTVNRDLKRLRGRVIPPRTKGGEWQLLLPDRAGQVDPALLLAHGGQFKKSLRRLHAELPVRLGDVLMVGPRTSEGERLYKFLAEPQVEHIEDHDPELMVMVERYRKNARRFDEQVKEAKTRIREEVARITGLPLYSEKEKIQSGFHKQFVNLLLWEFLDAGSSRADLDSTRIVKTKGRLNYFVGDYRIASVARRGVPRGWKKSMDTSLRDLLASPPEAVQELRAMARGLDDSKSRIDRRIQDLLAMSVPPLICDWLARLGAGRGGGR